MKKSLLSLALMATTGIFAQKNAGVYILDIQKDLFTSKMDTVNLSKIDFVYTGSIENPKLIRYKQEDYNYNKDYSRFEQSNKLETFGTVASLGSNFLYSDSIHFSFPAKNGSLDWQLYHKTYATKDNQGRVTSNKSYTDFSYFDFTPIFYIPKGFIFSSRDAFFYSGNKQTILSTRIANGFIQDGIQYVSDSTIRIADKQDRDSLLFEYSFNEEDSTLYLSSKTSTVHTDKNNWTETTTSYEVDGTISSQSKIEHTSGNLVEVSTTYNYDEGWALSAVDSTFYDADSISNLVKTYEMSVFSEELELSKISITSKSLNFLKGNPIPTAPKNFTIWSLLSSARTDGTQETHPGYELKWDDESYNETGFEIYRKEVGSSDPQPTLIHTTTANIETYTDHDVQKGIVYEYYIIAIGEVPGEGSQIQNKSLPVAARSDGTTGTEEQILFASIAVSPNPIENEMIALRGLQGTANYEIYTVEGQQIAQGTVSAQETIATNGLQKGMYLLKLQQAGSTKAMKFEKK